MPEDVWFTHNAYAEWHLNTIRIPSSPAAQHHEQVHGETTYDDFLDASTARDFDPAGSSPWSTPPGPCRSWSGPPTWTWPTPAC